MTSPVQPGDRLLLSGTITGLDHPAWANVERVEFHEDPADLPWNTGPTYPYRVGFTVNGTPQRGTIWLNDSGQARAGGISETRHA